MNKTFFLLCLLMAVAVAGYGQAAATDSCSPDTFVKTYTGSGASESFLDVMQTSDGNYLVSGTARSTDPSGGLDAILLKLKTDGSIIWQKKYPLQVTQSFIQAT